MTGFINGVVAAGKVLGRVYEVVERFMDKDKFYNSPRDTSIINSARRIYLEVFVNRPLPSELRYHHESQDDDEILSARPSEPSHGNYRPPYLLPESYSITDVNFGRKEIDCECRNAVLAIHNFLNQLNRKASEFNVISEYGHKNDAIRFIFYLGNVPEVFLNII